MKKFVLNLTFLFVFFFAASALAGGYNLAALKGEVMKAVPGGQSMGESGNEYAAFVGMQVGEMNYQFTLAPDVEPGIPDAKKVTYKGRTAYFFEPGMPGAGGLMILLGEDKSLTILCMSGFSSEKEIHLEDMTAVADKMNLDVL